MGEFENKVVAIRSDLESHLSGARSGECANPTLERLVQAKLAGEELTARGEGEGRRWRLSPVLDELKRRKTIDDVMHRGVTKFLEDYWLGHYVPQRSTGYGERMPKGVSEFSPEDTRLHHFRKWQRAMAAVSSPEFDVVLRWVLGQLNGNVALGCPAMMERYAPGLGSQTAVARCGMILSLFCARLAVHYGYGHELLISRCVDELSRLQDRFKIELERANRDLLAKQESA